jgi:RimJ/RimL family protein N-acetyltransferase
MTLPGTPLLVRPLECSDGEGIAGLFARLSPESRARRFLGPKPSLSPHELAALTRIDHDRHEAIAAVDERDGSIVGVARFVRDAERPDVAEVALAVADDWQGRGVGTGLARLAVDRAAASGVRVLTASTLSRNQPAWALLRRFGFRLRGIDLGVARLEAPIG